MKLRCGPPHYVQSDSAAAIPWRGVSHNIAAAARTMTIRLGMMAISLGQVAQFGMRNLEVGIRGQNSKFKIPNS